MNNVQSLLFDCLHSEPSIVVFEKFFALLHSSSLLRSLSSLQRSLEQPSGSRSVAPNSSELVRTLYRVPQRERAQGSELWAASYEQ